MLARTLIILTYLMATMLSPAQASVCDEMAVNDGYIAMTGEIVADVSDQLHGATDNHKETMPPCASGMDSNMASSIMSADAHMSADECNDMCTTVCAPSGMTVTAIAQLVTNINLPESIVLPVTSSQVLAAHKTRQLRPPIS